MKLAWLELELDPLISYEATYLGSLHVSFGIRYHDAKNLSDVFGDQTVMENYLQICTVKYLTYPTPERTHINRWKASIKGRASIKEKAQKYDLL